MNLENKTVNPLISIITVVFNSEKLIERTIQSVISQSYTNVQYIIIDGKSRDNTVAIIKMYESQISYWISESDKGLYDAMNKGLAAAKGDYILFLNSGDTFYENRTLEKAFASFNYLPDIVYGETMIVDETGNEKGTRRLKAPEKLSWKSFKHGMLVCHQSIFVKKTIAEPYNLKYKVSADFEWVLKALKKSESVYNTHLYISRFLDGGINKKNMKKGLIERFKIMSEYYGLFPVILRHFWFATRLSWFWLKNRRF